MQGRSLVMSYGKYKLPSCWTAVTRATGMNPVLLWMRSQANQTYVHRWTGAFLINLIRMHASNSYEPVTQVGTN
jgi:hypothetical protein